jgi:hypothetical protein
MKMMIHQTLSRPDSSIATIARVWTSSYISYTTTTTTAIVRVLLSCSHPYCHCYYCNQSRWRLTHCDDCYCRLLCIIFRVGYRAYLSVFGMCLLGIRYTEGCTKRCPVSLGMLGIFRYCSVCSVVLGIYQDIMQKQSNNYNNQTRVQVFRMQLYRIFYHAIEQISVTAATCITAMPYLTEIQQH